MKDDPSTYTFFGFDIEGDFDTLQLYSVIRSRRYAFMFQLNFIAADMNLPNKLFQLLNMKKLVFIGRNSELEAKQFFQRFGFSLDRMASIT